MKCIKWMLTGVLACLVVGATNDWERSNAAQVVRRLESIPTNQLNDVSWIAE